MENDSPKCVMVIAEGLSLGLMANTAGVLAVSLGRKIESIVGPDVSDGSEEPHAGLIQIPLPILTSDAETMKRIRSAAAEQEGVLVIDFTDQAQESRTYPDYVSRMSAMQTEELTYLGIALYGPRKAVSRLTGNLPLLREPATPRLLAGNRVC